MNKPEYKPKGFFASRVGWLVFFEGFRGSPCSGVLEYDGQNYWLPFCGKVNALTVRVYDI